MLIRWRYNAYSCLVGQEESLLSLPNGENFMEAVFDKSKPC